MGKNSNKSKKSLVPEFREQCAKCGKQRSDSVKLSVCSQCKSRWYVRFHFEII